MNASALRDPFSARSVRQGTTKQSPPLPVAAPSVEQLLTQAEACPLEPVRMLAKQIRTAVEQLRTKLEDVAAFTATQRELLDAEALVAELRAKLAKLAHAEEPPPTGNGQPQPPDAPRTAQSAAAANGKDIRYSNAVRDWARSRGMKVANNGRIADTVINAYRAAH